MSSLLVAERKVFKEDARRLGDAAREVSRKLAGEAEIRPLAGQHVLRLIWGHEYKRLARTGAGDIKGLSEDETLGIIGESFRQSPTALQDLKALPTKRPAFLNVQGAVLAGYYIDAPATILEWRSLTTDLDELNGSLGSSAWSSFRNIVPVAIVGKEDNGDPDILEALESQRPKTVSFQPLNAAFR